MKEAAEVTQVTIYFTMIALACGAYYLGIFLRYYILPGKDAPQIKKQLLLGIVGCIVVVLPLGSVLVAAYAKLPLSNDPQPVVVALALVVEHGIVMNETITKWLETKIQNLEIAAQA